MVQEIAPVVIEPAPAQIMGERTTTIEISPGDARTNEALGYEAKSVRVDNPASQWWYLVNQRQWVPPWTIGMVIQFTSLSQSAVILGITPAKAIITNAPDGTENCTFVFSERAHIPTPGIHIPLGTS